MTINVRATSLNSAIYFLTFSFIGTGVIFLVFQTLGVEEVDKDRLNIREQI